MAKVVAVVGASNNRRKYGNKALRAFRHGGYDVVPIHPHERVIEGIKAYASVLDVPYPIDMATLYVPPGVGEKIIGEIAAKQIPEVWLNPGAESPALVSKAQALKLRPILACSIVGIGEDPADF